jgi:hypothetical protein
MDPHYFGKSRIRIHIRVKSLIWIRIRIKVKMRIRRLIMEPWRVCMPVIANFYYFDDVKDPYLELYTVYVKVRSGSASQ